MARRQLHTSEHSKVRRAFAERCWPLTHGEPPPGAHLISARRGYTHHGIYVGDRRVVHYSGLAKGLRAGPIEATSLEEFSDGHELWVFDHRHPRFDRSEVIARARSRLGENAYRLLSNNCEHFCRWCVLGEARSQQVERLRSLPKRALSNLLARIAALTSRPSNASGRLLPRG